jgi:hypothetical protein
MRVAADHGGQPALLVTQLIKDIETVAQIGRDRAGVIVRPSSIVSCDHDGWAMATRAPASRARSANRGPLSFGAARGKSTGSPVATICQYSPALVPMARTSAPIRMVKLLERSLRVSAMGQSR